MQDATTTSSHVSRLAALRIVHAHLESGAFPDRELESVVRDHGFVMQIVYGVIRQRRALRWILSQLVEHQPSQKPEAALLVGLYQLFFMPGMQPHAAVNETVEAVKSCMGARRANFANAVLRRALREKESLSHNLDQQEPGIRLSHPDILITRWRSHFGDEATWELCRNNNLPADVIIRIHPGRTNTAAYTERLQEAGIECRAHPHAPDRFLILPHGVHVQDLPGYKEGLFTVQDPATSLAVETLDPQPGECILDACAAPGGKAMLIAERMQDNGLLVAMDLYDDRLSRLRENADRMRLSFLKIIQGDATGSKLDGNAELRKLAPKGFDRILLDAPCTNTGVIRRRPDARWRFTLKRMEKLVQTQRAILDYAATLLRPGGRVVYSTCSLEPEENEELISTWIESNSDFQLAASHRLFSPESGTDGAHAVQLLKRGSDEG